MSADRTIGSMILHYQLIGSVGSGGMGVVWRVLDTKLDREVALKFLPNDGSPADSRRQRFLREAKAASGLNHPNIVTIHEINSYQGENFIAMELVPGKSLSELLRQRRHFTPVEALHYGLQIAEGLGVAHRAGIVHRDIKPGNIMSTDDGLIKILDFGLAKLSDPAPRSGPLEVEPTLTAPLTESGVAVGTVGYMAPEQVVGDPIDARADIFCAGLVLYELLSGQRPFRGNSHAEIMRAVLTLEPPPVNSLAPEIPEAFAEVVHRCLAKTPASRYADGYELALALRRISLNPSAATALTLTMPTITAMPRRSRRRWVRTAIAAALGLIAIGSASYYARHRFAPATQAKPPSELYLRAREYLQRYDRKGNVDKAIDALQIALKQDAASAAVYAALGEAYVRRDMLTPDPQWPNLAADSARRAVALNDDLAEAHVALGMALAESGRSDQAEPELQRARDLDPLNGRALVALAKVRAAQGRRGEAEELFRNAVEVSPTDWIALGELAPFYYRNAQYPDAVSAWQKALQIAPDNARLWRNLAAGYHSLDRYPEAADALQHALELDPNAATWANLGTARFFEGRYSDATRAMEKAVELGPTNYLYWGNLGDAYRWTPGEQPKAVQAYTRAIQLVRDRLAASPNDVEARGSLAVYLAKSGDKTGALREAASLDKAAGNTPGSKFKSALAYEIAGKRDDALRALASAMEARYSMHEIANEPELAQMRTDVRYHRLAARYGSPGKVAQFHSQTKKEK
ncbi:MAG TPA: protein kinase [Candidatus Acidoferrales bacterium]|jgi:serine/threonine protein kinase/Tfp pilus assembly protein PilF|nr:protein kinase [Candidatus Acidoferrales bacterium]